MIRRLVVSIAILALIAQVAFTPTATAAASRPSAGVAVVGTPFSYVDSIGNTHEVGLVENFDRVPVTSVKVTVSYRDASGSLILSNDSYSQFDVLDPGDISPFEIISTVYGNVATTSFSVDWQFTTDVANTYFGGGVFWPPTFDDAGIAHLTGVVQNLNNVRASYVQVAVTCRDAIGWTFVNSNVTSDIEPGRTAPFEVLLDDSPSLHSSTPACFAHVYSPTPPSLDRTVVASPAHVLFGRPMTFSGTATPGETLSLMSIQAGGGELPIPGTVTTVGADGTFAVTVPLTFFGMVLMRPGKVDPTMGFLPIVGIGETVPILVWPDALITIKTSTSRVGRGMSITLSGLVKPSSAGGTVTIQRLVAGTWRRFATATLGPSSTYTIRQKLAAAGRYTLRATIPDEPDSYAGTSPSITVVVS
jgi:hypothetical protein